MLDYCPKYYYQKIYIYVQNNMVYFLKNSNSKKQIPLNRDRTTITNACMLFSNFTMVNKKGKANG